MKNYNQIEIENINNSRYSIIESLLFVSGDALEKKDIANILDISENEVESTIDAMIRNYGQNNDRGIKIIKVNDRYQLVTKNENSSYIQKLLKKNSRQSLSQAALETLSIISYKQPITRVDIDEIRGVKSDRAIVTLMEKNLIKDCGRLDVPGRPILYSTTDEFLRYFNLESIKELPNLDSFYTANTEEETEPKVTP